MNNKTVSSVTYNHLIESINCVDKMKKTIIIAFCDKYINYYKVLRFFVKHFDESLSNPLKELSFYTYVAQLLYYNKIYKFKAKNTLISVINAFYRFYQTYELNLFTKDNYSTQLLHKIGIGQDICNGFQVVNYNILDKIPNVDKWIVCYKANETSECINVNRVDFSIIENKTFKYWVKTYVWKYDALFSRKISLISTFVKAFNYINDLKTGKQLSFYTTPNNNYDDINTQEIMAFKSYILSKYENADTQGKFIYNLKSLLLLISENGIHKFEPGVFMTLIHHKNFFRNNGRPIPDSDLKQLSYKLSELAKTNIVYNLYYLVFYMALETELRPKSIFDLETNCIRETAKKNEYILCATSKTSHQEQVEIPITIFVKKCIDKVLKLTSKYRMKNTNESLKSQLFIIPNKNDNGFIKMSYWNFNTFLKSSCSSNKALGPPLKLFILFSKAVKIKVSSPTKRTNNMISLKVAKILCFLLPCLAKIILKSFDSNPSIIYILQ